MCGYHKGVQRQCIIFAYPVIVSATYALVVNPDLPFTGAPVPTLARMVPLVKAQRVIQPVQVVTVNVHHVIGTPRGVGDPREYAPWLVAHYKLRLKTDS